MAKVKALGLSTEATEPLIDAEHQMIKDKLDHEERALNRESKRKELEAEAEKVYTHELRMAEIRPDTINNSNVSTSSTNISMPKLKLPTFHDNRDDMNSYLLRFECIAKLQGWFKTDDHVHLGSCLRGHALKVYISLSVDTVKDYHKLKKALEGLCYCC